MFKFQWKAFLVFLLLLLTEVLIALFVHDNFIRPYIGDVLVVMVIYFFLKSFLAREIKLLPLYVFIFATAVEISQYFNLVDRLGLGEYRAIRIILGTTFDPQDILCYLVGSVLLFLGQIYFEKRKSGKQ